MKESRSTSQRFSDGGTLTLLVSPRGAANWIQRITVAGKRHDLGLGGWPIVSLAKARQRAFANRIAVSDGRDPLAEKRKARTPTFREAARKTYEANRPRWRSRTTARIWMAQMELHAFPVLGDLPVDRVGRGDVLRVLTPLWTSKPDIARKLRGRIRSVLAWCQAHGLIEHNVAADAIDGALPAMPAVKAHHKAVPHQEVAAALEAVRGSGASLAAKLGFEFLVLTAARAGEVRLATWAEIDEEGRTWHVPGERMKTGVEWRVPLSDAALAVLERVRPLRGPADLLFPSPTKPSRPLSNMAWSKLLKELGVDAVPHGFRSSFRDWCADTGKEREIAEAALAHTVGGVEGAYFRSDLFERRRRLMDAWAQFLAGGAAKVVRLSG